MHTGMLWFDNSQSQITVKIQNAKNYYIKKYERTPDLCLVHPSALGGLMHEGKSIEIEGLTVRPYRSVLPGHIWIGIEKMPKAAPTEQP